MKIHLHQTHHAIADFNEIENYLFKSLKNAQNTSGIHLFPELFLTGYPLQDLVLQKPFIRSYLQFFEQINKFSTTLPKNDENVFLIGGLSYELSEDENIQDIYNVAFELKAGYPLKEIYRKRLLPNYDIFDEEKYYTAGKEPCVYKFNNKKIGVLICEDMWPSHFHSINPCQDLLDFTEKNEIKLDLLVNLSASPFHIGKEEDRIRRSLELSNMFNCPFAYVNKVGGEDEILFDGQSFICDGVDILASGKVFEADYFSYELKEKNNHYHKNFKVDLENTWENLFAPRLEGKKLKEWNNEECEMALKALQFGFQEYAKKNSFKNFSIALSGGMDSSLVLAIMRLSLKPDQSLEAIYMPSIYSKGISYELSAKLCENLNIPLYSLPIKFLHSTAKNLFTQTFPDSFEGLTDENIQSRLRGLLLYTRSNQKNSMVVNTSNKSELSVGYSTQYGDSVGAISLLGDLYKSQVYRLARYINDKYSMIIPEEIITRPPSAELKENQIDQDSLPSYDILDGLLEGILSYKYDLKSLKQLGFSQEEVVKVFNLYRKSEYKRSQFCPIIKIAAKSYGLGYRVPISKKSDFYLEE